MAIETTLGLDALDVPARKPVRLWRSVFRRHHSSVTDRPVQQYPQQAPESRRPLRPASSQKHHDRAQGYGYDGHSAHTSVSGDSVMNTAPHDGEYRHARPSQRTADEQIYSPNYPEFNDAERMSGHEDDHVPARCVIHSYILLQTTLPPKFGTDLSQWTLPLWSSTAVTACAKAIRLCPQHYIHRCSR